MQVFWDHFDCVTCIKASVNTKLFSFIKPMDFLDTFCGIDPEMVGFETTKSCDKNLAMDSTLLQKQTVLLLSEVKAHHTYFLPAPAHPEEHKDRRLDCT